MIVMRSYSVLVLNFICGVCMHKTSFFFLILCDRYRHVGEYGGAEFGHEPAGNHPGQHRSATEAGSAHA